MENIFYFDEEEVGLSKNTSHPIFNKIVTGEFYYDLLDDFSPFGNDTGAETLMELVEFVQENSNDDGILEWMFEYIDNFGFKYQSKGVSQLEKIEDINQILSEDEFMINCMDQAIIATGFGQLKITGKLDKELEKITHKAIERQILINRQILSSDELDLLKTVRVVDGISTRPDEEGRTSHLTKKYIERMQILKRDLNKIN